MDDTQNTAAMPAGTSSAPAEPVVTPTQTPTPTPTSAPAAPNLDDIKMPGEAPVAPVAPTEPAVPADVPQM